MKESEQIAGSLVNEGALLLLVPTSGHWDYVEIIDNEDCSRLCENCNKEWIRWEHHLRHKKIPGMTKVVGCICVQKLITFKGTGVDPKAEENKVKKVAAAKVRRAKAIAKKIAKIDEIEISWHQVEPEKYRGITDDKKSADRVRYTVFKDKKNRGFKWLRIGQDDFAPRFFKSIYEAQVAALGYEKSRRKRLLIELNTDDDED